MLDVDLLVTLCNHSFSISSFKVLRRVACENNYMSRVTIDYSQTWIVLQFKRFCILVQVEGGWALVLIFAETHHLPYILLFDIVVNGRLGFHLTFTISGPVAIRHTRSQDGWQQQPSCENRCLMSTSLSLCAIIHSASAALKFSEEWRVRINLSFSVFNQFFEQMYSTARVQKTLAGLTPR